MKFTKIAVIGCNSFAGSNFISNILEKNIEIVGFNRTAEDSLIFLPYRNSQYSHNYKFVKADLNLDYDLIFSELEKFEPQVIIDFAGQGMVAESWQNPIQWFQTNVLSKIRLHEYLRTKSWLSRYVRISTPEVYGSQDNLLKENWLYNPSTPYAVSHAAIDLSLRSFQHQYKFPVIFCRFANFYGPGQQLYRIIPRTIIYALKGKKLQLHGGGTSVRAFIHTNDVTKGILASLNNGNIGDIYHFSSNRFLTIKSVVELICERMGIEPNNLVQISGDRPGKDQAYLMDSTKARSELNWQDDIKFEDGIDQTISWVKNNFDIIEKLPLNYIHKP